MAIRAVFFDCGNVLVTYKTQEFFDELKKHSRNEKDPSEFFGGFNNRLFVEFELGRISFCEFYQCVKKEFNLNSGYGFEDFKKLWFGIVVPDPVIIGIKDVLKRKGLITALITNNNQPHMHLFRSEYPRVLDNFDYIMVSSRVGIRKPNVEMWIRPMEALGLKAEECLFVEDREENLLAFRNLGGLTYQYDPTRGRGVINMNILYREREYIMATLGKLGLF